MARSASKAEATHASPSDQQSFESSQPDPRDPPESRSGGNPPVHSVRYRNIKASVWKNPSENGEFYSVTVSRSWQDEQKQWHDSASFNFNDLPLVAKAINDCHSWIAWQQRQQSRK